MKILIGSLVAGLLLSLSLSTKANSQKFLKCTLFVGENMEIRLADVVKPSMTEIKFENVRGITFTATAIHDLVNVYAKIDQVTISNSGKNSASLDIFGYNDGPVTVSCELTEQTPF